PGQAHWNDPLKYQIVLDYVPPGRAVEVAWRWKAPQKEYMFFETDDRSPHLKVEPEHFFWGAARDNDVGKASGFEVIARVYLGKETKEQAQLSTGWISLQEGIPDTLEVSPSQKVIVQGGR